MLMSATWQTSVTTETQQTYFQITSSVGYWRKIVDTVYTYTGTADAWPVHWPEYSTDWTPLQGAPSAAAPDIVEYAYDGWKLTGVTLTVGSGTSSEIVVTRRVVRIRLNAPRSRGVRYQLPPSVQDEAFHFAGMSSIGDPQDDIVVRNDSGADIVAVPKTFIAAKANGTMRYHVIRPMPPDLFPAQSQSFLVRPTAQGVKLYCRRLAHAIDTRPRKAYAAQWTQSWSTPFPWVFHQFVLDWRRQYLFSVAPLGWQWEQAIWQTAVDTAQGTPVIGWTQIPGSNYWLRVMEVSVAPSVGSSALVLPSGMGVGPWISHPEFTYQASSSSQSSVTLASDSPCYSYSSPALKAYLFTTTQDRSVAMPMPSWSGIVSHHEPIASMFFFAATDPQVVMT